MHYHSHSGATLAAFTVALTMTAGHAAAFSEPSPAPAESGAPTLTLTFRGVEYFHRWSKDGQNEFTPDGQTDLSKWNDMLTINVHEGVRNGDQLAELANRVLGSYQSLGPILGTHSTPRTRKRPAEHFVACVLPNPGFLEAVFARFVLSDGVGIVAVFSHRVYAEDAGPEMSRWLEANGPQVEQTLMAWDQVPQVPALKRLPQSD
jgi:hypothetical protein